MKIHYDRFYRYAEFTEILHAFVKKFPQLLSLESIGKSFEGKDIWVVTATNQKTGAAVDKPAYWVDANIHASELAGGAASLYLIDTLTKNYGKRDDITRCMDTRVMYICPRINPDGAEWAMRPLEEGGPKIVRSSTRPYPHNEDHVDGMDIEDVNGDGRILSMRIKDDNGNWKTHPDEPRLMIPRGPTEYGGTYYRMLPEGTIRNYDGVSIKVNKDKQGLDLNRNFPAGWRQEHEQFGAGPYPTSEPEVRAVVHFITHHGNITGGLSFHTWSGVLLRPFATMADDEMPPEDLWTYKKQGEEGTRITGYPAISVYHEFRYHPKEVITGAFDWIYEHLGLYEWTIEIWCPMREAGIKDYKYIDWFRHHPVEDDLKMIAWADKELKGKGYIDWAKFDHPQLGEVEIGGWDKIHAFRNPPPHLLEKEIAKFPDWLVWNALISPKLELVHAKAENIGGDSYRIEVAVQNTGYLPSYVSKRAHARKQSRGVVGEISLPKGATLVSGKLREVAGELEGRAYKHTLMSFWTDTTPTADKTKLEWVVNVGKCAPKDRKVDLVIKHEKAGTVRSSIKLK
ncbi:MAG: M14 family metallopeptidase [Burkholderiales bacterium]|nr:M14 family metallopeptidase [Burkholderiales bacterium]